jgi:hypothetical protein
LEAVLTTLSFRPALGYPRSPFPLPVPHSYPFAFRLYAFSFFTLSMSDHPSLASQPSSDSLNTPSPPRKWARQAWIHITRHVGLGIICSVAYFDPYVSLFSCSFSPQTYPSLQGKLGRRFASWLRFWVQTPLRCPAGRILCRDSSGDLLRFYPTLLTEPHPFVEGINM